MSSQFSSHEDLLARLVREAGDPSVSPDPQYAQTLRKTILDGVGPAETVAHPTEAVREADASPIITLERTRKMKRIAKFAVAATVLVALCILTSWMTIGGGSTNIAFANVADALDSLRSATYDMTSQAKGEEGQPSATVTGKGFFLAPSLQRVEMSVAIGPTRNMVNSVMIIDGQAAKIIHLLPSAKLAVLTDMNKMREEAREKAGKSGELAKDAPGDVFEIVRRLVREGSSGTGEKAERLGKKEIDGREAVGFRVNHDTMDMTLWADPETARPIRVEIVMDVMTEVRMVMNNFRYNVDLDPSLFSLEPPEGYSTQAMEMRMPVEEDLLGTLRTVAEHGEGVFPAEFGMNKEVMELLEPERDKLTEDKIEAAFNEVLAKYGGKDELREKYGKDIPPEIMAEIQNAVMPLTREQIQKQLPLRQKRMRGITFYTILQPKNDPHYVGGGVKLGTPDCPILWYKPTGAEKYRVIYADLSVKDMAPDDVKKLPEATPK